MKRAEIKRRATGYRPAAPIWERVHPARLLAVHGLLILLLLLIIIFSVLLPQTFPTAFNARSILADKSVVAFLALAVMVPLAANKFDLSVGYVVGITHILAIGLQMRQGWPWEAAVIASLLAGCLIGLVNGVLVAFVKIDSFIATLGVGTVVLGISDWYTNGMQLAGPLPKGFLVLTSWTILSVIPGSFVYVLVAGTVLWLVLEYFPVGRRLYALGSNARAAELVGIRASRYVLAAFICSGLLSALGGIVLASQLQAAQSALGPDFLLPAFVGALLGATSVRPGRVNVVGTLLAVLLLAVGISGLEQEGAQFFVEPLFNGSTLIVAVTAAVYAARRRLQAVPTGVAHQVAGTGGTNSGPGSVATVESLRQTVSEAQGTTDKEEE